MGKYVIVMYEGEYFPGLVTEIVASDVKVKTMAPCLGGWPKNDEIYYTMDNVIKRIETVLLVNCILLDILPFSCIVISDIIFIAGIFHFSLYRSCVVCSLKD